MKIANWKKTLTGVSFMALAVVLAGCESKESKAEKFAQSGMAYLEEGDIESANLQFNNALFNDGQNLVALRGAAEIAETQKKFTRQGRMLARILEVVPDDIDANNEFARLSLMAREFDRANELANRVLEQDAENVMALTTLAAVLVLEERSEEAEGLLQRALQAEPENPEIYNLLAAGKIRSEEFDEAIRILDQGIATVEEAESLIVVRLVLAEQHLDTPEVLATFEQLIKAAPENALYRKQMAEYVLTKQQDLDKAEELFEDALPYVEDPTEIYTRLVAIERNRNGNDAAEARLKELVARSPDVVNTRFLLPTFYCQVQKFEDCRASLDEMISDQSLNEEDKDRARNGLADIAIIQRDFEQASVIAEGILENDPQNATALITRGQVQMSRENVADAIESFRSALESEPDNAEGLVYLALAYEASDQKNFADAQFARALDQVGYQRAVVDQYRNFLIRNGEFDRSMQVLDRYLRENPTDTNALLQRAEGAIAQGDFSDAEESARQLITEGEYSYRAGSILAQSLFSQDRLADALPIADEILANNPDDPGNRVLRASILQKLGRAEEAVKELEDKIMNGSAQAMEYALLGDLLNNQGKHAAARRVSVEGLTKYPGSEQLFVLAYVSESKMGNPDGGIAVLIDGIQKADTTAQLRTFLSNEYVTAGRFDDAVVVLQSLADDNALTPLTANNLASILLEDDESIEEALRVARMLEGARNPYFLDTLAWAYYRNGQAENAARYSRAAMEGLSNNPDVLYHAGMIELELGNVEAARDALVKAKNRHYRTAQTTMKQIDDALASF